MVAGAMVRTARCENHYQANRQSGIALIVVLILLGLLVSVLAVGFTGDLARQNKKQQQSADALARVKDALIGWSASRTQTGTTPNGRPGELPCPDIDNTGTDAGGCLAGAIGRVPWKSLGIPEPKDGEGETLWYAIAGPFRNYSMTTAPITSDTLGNLTVYVGSSASTITPQAIAVIFAPGAALGTQNRDPSSTAVCPTTGATIARNLCAANYLDATGSVNNANTGGPFIMAQPSSTFNDRLLAITNADLMPIVEQRVAREIRALLQSYKSVAGVYPWADSNGNGISVLGSNRGHFPCDTFLTLPVPWGNPLVPSLIPVLPKWLKSGCGVNGWASVIYYTAAPNQLLLSACLTCTLSVNNVPGTALVLLTPGAATGPRTWVSGYFEDAENNGNNDDKYSTPTSTEYNRDRIYTVP